MSALRPIPSAATGRSRRRGQTLIFVMMVLAILSFVMFSVYDVQQVTSVRVRAQNASDAAALVGAKWQLTTLNAIGELNLLKLTTAIIDAPPSPYVGPVPVEDWWSLYNHVNCLTNAIEGLQTRISIIGPWLGVFYAQQAAKLNGMHTVSGYTDDLQRCVTMVRTDDRYPSWIKQEVADIMQAIVDQGVAAYTWGIVDPGSFEVDGPTAKTQYLFTGSFYNAVHGHDWCYLYRAGFYSGPPSYECTYGSATESWGKVSRGERPPVLQPLPLWIESRPFPSDDLEGQLSASMPTIQRLASARNLTLNPNFERFDGVDTNYPNFTELGDPLYGPFYVPLHLYCYQAQWNWPFTDSEQDLRLRGRFKPKFEYGGADTVCAVQGTANVVMAPANPNQVSWTSEREQEGLRTAFGELAYLTNRVGTIGRGIEGTAAAKPFGQIDENTPPNGTPGSPIPIVLPVFDAVRLIPIRFSSAKSGFDPMWQIHLRDHLHPYTYYGIGAISADCFYCYALIKWESPSFRADGTAWLQARSQNGADPCPPGQGGGAPGGPPNH